MALSLSLGVLAVWGSSRGGCGVSADVVRLCLFLLVGCDDQYTVLIYSLVARLPMLSVSTQPARARIIESLIESKY